MSKGAGPIPTQPGGQERQTAVPADAAAWHPPPPSRIGQALEKTGRFAKKHGPKILLVGVAGRALMGGEVAAPDFQAAATANIGRAPITREIKGEHSGSHDSGVTTKTSGDDGKGKTPGFSPTDGKGKGSSMTVWSSKNPGPNSAAIAEFRSGRESRGKEPVVNGQKGNQTADRFFRPPSHPVQEVLNRGNDQGDATETFLRGLFFGKILTGCAAQAPTTLVYETVQSERPSPLPTATLTLDQGNSDQANLASMRKDEKIQSKVERFQEATRELLYRQFGNKAYTKWEITYTVDDASYNNLKRDQFPSFFVTNLATGERYVPAFWGEPGNIGFVAVPERAEWHRVTSTQDDSSFLGPHEPTMVYMDDMDVLNGRPIPRVYNRDIGAYLDFNLIPDFSAQDEERFVQTFVDAFNANRSVLRNIAEEQHDLDAKDNPQKIVAFSPVYRPDGSVRFLLEDQTRGGRQDFIIRSDGKKVYVPETPEDDKSPESNKKQWRRVLDPVNGVYSYEKQVWNGDEYTWEVVAIFAEDSGPMGEIINLNLLRQAQPDAKVTTTPIVIEPTQTVSPVPETPTPDLKSPTPDQPSTPDQSPTPDPPTPQVDTPAPPTPTEDVVEPSATLKAPTPILETATPKATKTPRPEVTPHPYQVARNIDVGSFPDEVFGNQPVSIQVGDYYYARGPDIGSNTIVERLQGYPGFNGPIVHTVVNGPPPLGELLQHAFINVERASDRQVEGEWAFEASYLVLRAPARLVHSGNSREPLVMLQSLQMHLPDQMFRAAGGVHLLTEDGKNYYVSVYRVNRGNPGVTPDYSRKIPFKIGEKQGLKLELFYDKENNNLPTLRAFLIQDPDGEKRYEFIGQLPLASDIKTIRGDITWLGGYVSQPVADYEVVVGEAKVLRP